ncbi:MAG: hypothetical protein NT018_05560 [Armatimonadetes bacterium]|nr:hypothetical protein [Armatimonadota bacterium]
MPRLYQTPGASELRDKNGKFLRYVPNKPSFPYPFTTDLTGLSVSASSPDDAISQIVGFDRVKKQMPDLPIVVQASGCHFTGNVILRYGKLDVPTDEVSVRKAMNLLSLVTGKNWIAKIVKDSGKPKIEVRFFDKAEEVCPEVSKVYIELEDTVANDTAK